MPSPAPHRPTPPAAAPPGQLDPLILTALAAGRVRLDRADADTVIDRHQPAAAARGKRPTTCLGCGFRYRTGSRACPSWVFLTRGLRAALALVPPATTTRPCKVCRGPVELPAADPNPRPGGVVCDSCAHQPGLFDGLFGGAA
ncbi:hypothetical protein [Pseudofrankia sp. DC12]|uniref:hypothetical protein n=1 Tax=Pseudofrankia sp. DC12 TaxID=683315 RepID=UPI0005F7C1F9|nr:hypothetical protein [Pseudofrankia sp. DC12]